MRPVASPTMTGADDGNDAALAADERAALIAAHERRVDALRNSAQYRVGELVIASARSPRRLVRLPVDLWRLRKELLAENLIAPLAPVTGEPARQVVVATILDEFSHQAFAPEWEQRPLGATAPADQLTAIGPALLFVESAWEGNGGAFRYDLAHFAKRQGSPLRDVLVAADKADIPTVFWNKEDPVHFDDFADAASQFDWIFTTDADCIDRYVELAEHDRVAALPFAAQPRLHNPIGAPPQRLARACFAGSWQADNYADRGADVELLLRPVLDAGLLDIFDRMAAPGANGARFPAPYDRAVLGSRRYDDLLDEYRRYACFLNVNSVKTSPTMCSRRVFELLACRTPVVSTPSRAIDELLGDTVITVETQADARHAVERLTGDPEHRDRVGQLGYRAVMSRHTYGHRVDQILDTLGIASTPAAPRVTVLAPTNRPEFLDRLLDNFSRQRDVVAELIVLTNSDRFDRADVDRRLASSRGPGDPPRRRADDGRVPQRRPRRHRRPIRRQVRRRRPLRRALPARCLVGPSLHRRRDRRQEDVLRLPRGSRRDRPAVPWQRIHAREPGERLDDADRPRGFPEAKFAALNLGEDIDLCERAIDAGPSCSPPTGTTTSPYVAATRGPTAGRSATTIIASGPCRSARDWPSTAQWCELGDRSWFSRSPYRCLVYS